MKKEVMMADERFSDVWDALEESPVVAANMRARADIIIALQKTISGWKIPRVDAARRLSMTTARFDDLMESDVDGFDLETLLALATMADMKIEWRITSNAA